MVCARNILGVALFRCPSCQTELNGPAAPAGAYPAHACPALAGVMVPMVPASGPKSRHVLVEREDVVGKARGLVWADGRPISAVRTEREDGSNDTTIFAPPVETSIAINN